MMSGRTKKMNSVSLNLVVLRVPDINRAAEFYSAFGCVFAKHAHGKGPEHFAAEVGSTVFELYPEIGDAASTKGVRIGFQVADAASVLTVLEKKGAKVVSPLKDSPWGLRAVIDDPFGHRVEVSEAKKEAQPSGTDNSGAAPLRV
jgi:lactoylglutathione lyase